MSQGRYSQRLPRAYTHTIAMLKDKLRQIRDEYLREYPGGISDKDRDLRQRLDEII